VHDCDLAATVSPLFIVFLAVVGGGLLYQLAISAWITVDASRDDWDNTPRMSWFWYGMTSRGLGDYRAWRRDMAVPTGCERCVHCAEPVRREAGVCPNCQRKR
jgi:hypothetical protein